MILRETLPKSLANVKEAIAKLECCIQEIRQWMATNFLHLNDSKTELLLIGTKQSLAKLPEISFKIGGDTISPSDSARNIGAIFDQNLNMQNHISSVCKGAWYHLRKIGQIRQYLDNNKAAMLMHSFVSSRLDSFNSLLSGVPKEQLKKLQRVQNAAARVVTRTPKHDHITPVLKELHWLPIPQRIEYKILLLVFKSLYGLAPGYLNDLLQWTGTTRNLRHHDAFLLKLSKTRLVTFGDKAFSNAGPRLWNTLPLDLRCIDSVDIFKSRLKTYLFKQAYDS